VSIQIATVRNRDDLDTVITLFRAYAASLDVDLCFQNFEEELAAMPGKYAPPDGDLWLAKSDGVAIGCAALRPLDGKICEMKRLYVSPQGRGLGVGKALLGEVLQAAAAIGYGEIRLDTLPTMHAAIGLYRSSGFEVIPAYYDTPIAGTVFMRRKL
jgi:ribosomal protein S18 acetylase RimI-like enzyme